MLALRELINIFLIIAMHTLYYYGKEPLDK